MFRLLNEKEETEFRSWSRAHYTPGAEISELWHPVVQDECRLICEENRVRLEVETGNTTGKNFGLKD